jgi:hypothetical protein
MAARRSPSRRHLSPRGFLYGLEIKETRDLVTVRIEIPLRVQARPGDDTRAGDPAYTLAAVQALHPLETDALAYIWPGEHVDQSWSTVDFGRDELTDYLDRCRQVEATLRAAQQANFRRVLSPSMITICPA